MSRRLAAAALSLLGAAGCGPKATRARAPAPAAAASPAPHHAEVTATVEITLWSAEKPFERLTPGLVERDGILRKTPPASGETTARSWPYSLDQWGIARMELGPLLGPYEGAAIRVRGVYRKIQVEGTWHYEVDPDRIVLLPKK
ncbi:MAG TPA: hypothetical protein VMV18_09170 [bacterium]|nr:hypothetical protein [bacterium]